MPRREIEVRVIGEPDPERVAELLIRSALRYSEKAARVAPSAAPAAQHKKKPVRRH